MHLPKGRSNSDTQTFQVTTTTSATIASTPTSTQKSNVFARRISSPLLNINLKKTSKSENGGSTVQHAKEHSAITKASPPPPAPSVQAIQTSTQSSPMVLTPTVKISLAATPYAAGTIANNNNNNINNKMNNNFNTHMKNVPSTNDAVTHASNNGMAVEGEAMIAVLGTTGNWDKIDNHLETIQSKLKDGWTVHVGKEGRLFYCNHLTQTAGWLPSCEDWSRHEELPYGWERAIDSKGRTYFINHLNKTTTYEAPETIRWEEHRPPEPRTVVLQRSSSLGFGFVAGSERPVIVRFVTDGGPSMNKLQPGDQILAVNGEDVKEAPRDHVIQLVRASESQVTLVVCQPAQHNLAPGRKSTLLSERTRAKLRTRPSRVRFAESVCVNGAPLFPPSAFSLGDICVPPMANVLKVFLENGQTKSFKYDATTTVQDVVTSLFDKLCLKTGEIFSLVLEHVKSLKRNKLTLLDPEESLAQIAARPGAHKLRCLFRVTFVPTSAAELAQQDLNALDYLYMQCCNDVTQERFAPELQPEVALRLAALHMHQHALANNIAPAKLTVKVVEREFGLERFVPISIFEGMKRKELRRLVSHFLKMNADMTGSSQKVLTQLQAKLHYLDIIASLPSYGAKCFSTNQREGIERVLLVSPRFGLSQITSARNSVPVPISAIGDFSHVIVQREDDVTCSVTIFMQGDRVVKFSMEDRDACEFSLVLAGYFRLMTGKILPMQRQREQNVDEDNSPSFLAQHTVLPAAWSYMLPFHNRAHSINFLVPPPYQKTTNTIKTKTTIFTPSDENMQSERYVNSTGISNGNHKMTTNMDLDIQSVVATELLEEAKDSGLSDSSGGGSNYGEKNIHMTSINAFIEAKNEEVLRRVQEMQKMVESSEQYLNEHGEFDFEAQQRNSSSMSVSAKNIANSGVMEFDSDCDSLNSSKVSSTEENPQPGALKHSDSLVLLAEAINQDLSGITKGLNSINGSTQVQGLSLSATTSPRPERKFNGFGQLLSNIQALGTDYSQSESDSESVNSPTNSPTTRRPALLEPNSVRNSRKKNLAYRTSFGLHSPDGSNFGTETKDYNLKEYLKQLKEISNVDDKHTDVAKKLSEIHGFEIREDTFIETDSDLIDLRAIPPPQTPDELDALLILNAAPIGFDDGSNSSKKTLSIEDGDLDKFLAKVVVAPPTQKTTPAKELTPEEIMSYIIPPPPNLEEMEKLKISETNRSNFEDSSQVESLYSNSVSAKREFFQRLSKSKSELPAAVKSGGQVIEYATVERKSKFSCCPKSRKEETQSEPIEEQIALPPRSLIAEKLPPVRPPKSAELIQRLSPKKHVTIAATPIREQMKFIPSNDSLRQDDGPPLLPPRSSPSSPHAFDASTLQTAGVSLPPKKPPLPPIAPRSILKNSTPSHFTFGTSNGTTTSLTPPPTQTRPFMPSPTVTPHNNSNLMMSQSNGYYRSNSDCPIVCLQSPTPETRPQLTLLCSPQTTRKTYAPNYPPPSKMQGYGEKLIIKNGHVIDGEALLAKTDVAMSGLLVKLDQMAAQCTAAQSAGGGANIDEDKFQKTRNELTEQTLVLVTASKFLVVAMSDATLCNLPEHLTSCLTAIRRITELTQDMTRHTSSPLQTRNIVLKVHDVASSFRELVGVQIGPTGAGQLALQAECLANMLATLLRSLRIFSP